MTTFIHEISQIADLKVFSQWVCYSLPDKKPYNPLTGYGADCNNPETWATFDQAWRSFKNNPTLYAGVGYEFAKEQGITGVDLDKCIDESGQLSPFAQEQVRRLNSYTEYSPSGRGLHILVRGNIPSNLNQDAKNAGDQRIEMYDCQRYFTVTGKHLEGTPETIEDRQEELLALHSEITSQRRQAEQKRSQSTNHTYTPLRASGDTPYGLAALDKECHEVATMPEGGRNDRLNRAAYSLGQLVGGNQLYRSTVERELAAAADRAGLRASEIEKTIKSGLEDGMKEPRTPPVDELIYGNIGNNGNGGDGGDGAKKAPNDSNEPGTKFVLECLREGEYGDSILFAHIFRGQVIYDHTAGEWYTWKGHWWEEDGTGKIKHLVSGKLASVYIRAGAALNLQSSQQEARAQASGDEQEKTAAKERVTFIKKQIKELTERAFTLRQVSRCKNVLYFAQSHEGMGITGDRWDRNPWLLAVPNGVIDLRTGECRDGKPEDYIRTTSPTNWQGLYAPAPRWERFLQEIFDDRPETHRKELIAFLQRMLGYGITGEVIEHIFAILYGEDGRNGKDTIQRAISHALGAASGAIHKDVLLDTGRGHSAGAPTPHLSALQGRRIAWANEPEKGARFNVGQIKDLSGGGEIPTRGLHEKKFTLIKPSHLLVLLTNHKPHADSNDAAFWDRLRMITFNIRFVDKPVEANERKKDTALWTDLESEASGILAWLVRGCLEWQQQGLNTPQSVLDAGNDYRGEEDLLKMYIDERCVVRPEATVKASVLYQDFYEWAEAGHLYKMNKTMFGLQLGKKKITKKKTMNGFIYQGIGLLTNIPDDTHEQFMNSSQNCSYDSEAASQAPLEQQTLSNYEQYEQFQQVFTKNGSHEDSFLEKPAKTIHTIHTENDNHSVKPPVEPDEEGMNSMLKTSETIHKAPETIHAEVPDEWEEETL